jgi:ligand-binding SRPBCC domain-containing protein
MSQIVPSSLSAIPAFAPLNRPHFVLECEMTTSASLRDAFTVFENPYNLARITPSWLNFRILDEGVEMRNGAEISYRIRWLGLSMKWKTLITAYEPPFHFVDEQVRGPYTLWRHLHTFRPSTEGTVVSDRVEYILPLGFLGRLAHSAMVAAQLKQIFRFRQRKLAKLIGGVRETAEPVISRRG